jgi:hypothetical protein
MRVALQATEGATKMKSHTLSALRTMPAALVQIGALVGGRPRGQFGPVSTQLQATCRALHDDPR